MAAEQAPAKRPHLLLAQHVMTEVLEGMKDTVSSEGLDPTVLKELETVRLRHDARTQRAGRQRPRHTLTSVASPGSAGSGLLRRWAAWRATRRPLR